MSGAKIYEGNVSLKRCKHKERNISKKNVVSKGKTSKINKKKKQSQASHESTEMGHVRSGLGKLKL